MRYCLLLLVCVGFLSACKESTSPDHDKDGDNTIAGQVVLYDSAISESFYSRTLTDYSGVTVTIDGTNHKTVTDAYGHFQFDHLENGIYSITAAKPEFGTYHWYEQQLVNGKLDLPLAIFGRVSQVRPLLSIGDPYSASGHIDLRTDVPHGSGAFYCDRDSVAPPDAPHLAVTWAPSYTCYFSTSLLRTMGARKGDTLYFTYSNVFDPAEAVQYYEPTQSSYYDPIHRQTRYASCGPRSNVIMMVMPE